MAVRKTVVDADGLHHAVQTTVKLRKAGRVTKEDRVAITRLLSDAGDAATFEGAIRDAERYWRGVKKADRQAPRLSKAWYAAEILRQITWVRRIVRLTTADEPLKRERLEEWVVSAMNLGALLEEAEWRFGWVARAARYGVKQHKSARDASPKGVSAHVLMAEIRNAKLLADFQDYRGRNDGCSYHQAAKDLLPVHNPYFEPSRHEGKALTALAKKISRLDKK